MLVTSAIEDVKACSCNNRPGPKYSARTIIAGIAVFSMVFVCALVKPSESSAGGLGPDEVARLEAEMWRSYYAGQRYELSVKVAAALLRQFDLSVERSIMAAAQAARAAFIFKRANTNLEYEKALPPLVRFFEIINEPREQPFDAVKAAESELAWWIMRRKGSRVDQEELAKALAKTAAIVYHKEPEDLAEYGRLRVSAMTQRRVRAKDGCLSDEDWALVEALLASAYRSAWNVIWPDDGEVHGGLNEEQAGLTPLPSAERE